MIAITIMLSFILGALLCLVLALVFAGMWTYRDAKARGISPGLWTALVVLIPNFLGLLIYALTARREARRVCPVCKRSVPLQSAYCGSCGTALNPEDVTAPKSGPKGLLVGFFICLPLTFLLMLGGAVGAVLTMDGDWSPTVSTIYIENGWGDKWDVRWEYTNKVADHSFRIDEDGPQWLYYTGSSREGPLTLTVRQGEESCSIDLSGAGTTGSLDLSVFQPGKVYLELYNNKGEGRGVEFTSHWE